MKELSKEGGPHASRRGGRRKVEASRRKYHQPRYVWRRGAVLVALVAVFALAGLVAADYLTGGRGEINRGVRIGDLDVGGMTRGEALKAVRHDAAATFEKIHFDAGKEEFSVSGDDLGVKVNADSAVDEAYAVGRRGNIVQRLSDDLRSSLGGVQVDLAAGYQEDPARSTIKEMARKFYEKPQNASFTVTDDGKVEVKEAQNGRVLDQEATLANLDAALENLNGQVDLAVGPSPKPEISTAEVERFKPEKVIGKYQTDFLWDSNPNRQSNMKLAAEAVDNTVLAPGEVFSFNQHTEDLNYKEAKTFSNGGVGVANGGGLCQVSSTLYMAANYAGLQIVERHPHYAVLPYIKPGFDATVWFGENGWGALDMRFKNTTDGYILLREWVDDKGFLNAQILGQPSGKKVEMRTEKIYEDPVKGIKWTTYKKVTQDGKVLRDGFLHSYRYSFNPPVPDDAPHYDTSAPRVGGWPDPTNTTGWASPH